MASRKGDNNDWLWGLLIGLIGGYVIRNDKTPKIERNCDPLQKMKEMVNVFKKHPDIRRFTAALIKDCHPTDQIAQITKIFRFVCDNIAYMSDPHGGDYLSAPFETLRVKAGDC